MMSTAIQNTHPNPAIAWMSTDGALMPIQIVPNDQNEVDLETCSVPVGNNHIGLMLLDQRIPVPNNPITNAVVRSLTCSGKPISSLQNGWINNDDDKLHYSISTPRHSISISSNHPDFRNIFEQTNILVDVSAICLAVATFALQQGEIPIISTKEILQALDVQSFGEKRRRIAANIENAIIMLNSLIISYTDMPKRGVGMLSSHADNLLKATCLNPSSNNPYDMSWSLHLGDWASTYLNRSKNSFNWVSNMPSHLLTLDWRIQRPVESMAKYLAYTLVAFPGGTVMHTEENTRHKVKNLLLSIGEYPVPAQQGTNWAKRTRKQFEAALSLLVQKNVLTKAEYEQPLSSNRRWSREWLQSNLIFSTHPQPVSTS